MPISFGTPSFQKRNSLLVVISAGNGRAVNFIRFNSLAVRARNEKQRRNSATRIVIARNLMARTDLIILMQLAARFGPLYEERTHSAWISHYNLLIDIFSSWRLKHYDASGCICPCNRHVRHALRMRRWKKNQMRYNANEIDKPADQRSKSKETEEENSLRYERKRVVLNNFK